MHGRRRRRVGHADVVDVVLGARGRRRCQLAGPSRGDGAALQPAAADRDDQDGRRRHDDDDRQDGRQQVVERRATGAGELDRADAERQPADAHLHTDH